MSGFNLDDDDALDLDDIASMCNEERSELAEVNRSVQNSGEMKHAVKNLFYNFKSSSTLDMDEEGNKQLFANLILKELGGAFSSNLQSNPDEPHPLLEGDVVNKQVFEKLGIKFSDKPHVFEVNNRKIPCYLVEIEGSEAIKAFTEAHNETGRDLEHQDEVELADILPSIKRDGRNFYPAISGFEVGKEKAQTMDGTRRRLSAIIADGVFVTYLATVEITIAEVKAIAKLSRIRRELSNWEHGKWMEGLIEELSRKEPPVIIENSSDLANHLDESLAEVQRCRAAYAVPEEFYGEIVRFRKLAGEHYLKIVQAYNVAKRGTKENTPEREVQVKNFLSKVVVNFNELLLEKVKRELNFSVGDLVNFAHENEIDCTDLQNAIDKADREGKDKGCDAESLGKHINKQTRNEQIAVVSKLRDVLVVKPEMTLDDFQSDWAKAYDLTKKTFFNVKLTASTPPKGVVSKNVSKKTAGNGKRKAHVFTIKNLHNGSMSDEEREAKLKQVEELMKSLFGED